jgi:hypothetical protein
MPRRRWHRKNPLQTQAISPLRSEFRAIVTELTS